MIREKLDKILTSSSTETKPHIKKNFETSSEGIYIIGDLAGAPVIKYAMAQGHSVIEHITSLEDRSKEDDILDIIIAGAGASGLNAALGAKEKGLSFIVLEKNKIASTIKDFPKGKWVYAEPDSSPTKGNLWFDGARKEDIIKKWHDLIEEEEIPINTDEALSSIKKEKDHFIVKSSANKTYKAKRIIIATGKRGDPRKLNIKGETEEWVYHRLYNPDDYTNKNILIVGGGNSAIEAALAVCEKNTVYLSYRKEAFFRIFKDNRRLLEEKIKEKKIELILESEVESLENNKADLKTKSGNRVLDIDYAFVLIGVSYSGSFLKGLGIKMENDWSASRGGVVTPLILSVLSLFGLWLWGGHSGISLPGEFGLSLSLLSIISLIVFGLKGNRYSYIGLSFLLVYSIYAIKVGEASEFWPFTFWGYKLLSFGDRHWSFWYTVIYSILVLIFGISAMQRWGFARKDLFHVWRYISLITFQVLFFFIIPEFLFQWAIEYKWVGEALSNDPQFANQSFRAYGIVYAWPLFFYTFFYDPHYIWIIWGVFLSFILIPVLSIWIGKRYCSWVCGCGALAETLGDRWRHLAPKGKTSIKWETVNIVILIFAALATLLMLTKDVISLFEEPASLSISIYRVLVDVWFAGILPITLYPFLGGRMWCRYICPLSKFMEWTSALFKRLKVGRFGITANNKCIACGECSTNCQMGIDVMSFALRQKELDNTNSSCVGCGVCITVCPMDVLSSSKWKKDTVPLS